MCDLCERVDPLLEMILRGCAVQASRRTPFRITEVVSMISAIKVRDEQRVELALTTLDSVMSSFCLSPPPSPLPLLHPGNSNENWRRSSGFVV